jgi:hypothetical protein
MKLGIVKCTALVVLISMFSIDQHATYKRKPLQKQVTKGTYIPHDLVTATKLRDMPIPDSGQDYAIYQSIGQVSNIILGEFKKGENRLTLISDINSDGKIDLLTYYYLDTSKYRNMPNPSQVIDDKKFQKMKEDIVNGVISDIAPNPEGVPYIKKVVKARAESMVKIQKHDMGYIIHVADQDDPNQNKMSFSFSENGINGVDMAFDVYYYNVRETMVMPVIRYSVYVSKSTDKYAKEVVVDLSKFMKENYLE